MNQQQLATAARNGDLEMTIVQVLAGIEAGVLVDRGAPKIGYQFVPRACTDCGRSLSFQRIDGSPDTFPRCSGCAF
jgi:hypothetical protein